MKPRLSMVVFSIVYCVAYVVVLAMNAPLFCFYPRTSQFSWGWITLPDAGPNMAWYGLMTNAAIAATIAGVAVPEDAIVKGLRNRLWVFPLGALVGCVYLMKHFFVY